MNFHTPIWIIRDTIQNSVWHLIRRGRFTAPTADLSARPGDTLSGLCC